MNDKKKIHDAGSSYTYKATAKHHISVGYTSSPTGETKKIYCGKLFNPLTWFKYVDAIVVDDVSIDHAAYIKKD